MCSLGILTLGAGLGAGLGLAAGPVTVTGTVTDAKPFCSGLRKVTEYVYRHEDDQNIQVEEVRLFDKTFSNTIIPTAIANPISAAIGSRSPIPPSHGRCHRPSRERYELAGEKGDRRFTRSTRST